jgi:hypothetical protein
MQGDSPISWLMFFTLTATVFVIVGAFIYFLRSRTNREISSEVLEGNGSTRGKTPEGAAPELIGSAVLAVAAMALLVVGYQGKPQTETTSPVGGKGVPQSAGNLDKPKAYQSANPRPDMRSAPTSSDTGVGAENGSTVQPN